MDKPAAADPPISPLLATRWSPVGSLETPVSDDDLAGCFEAARWAADRSRKPQAVFVHRGRWS